MLNSVSHMPRRAVSSSGKVYLELIEMASGALCDDLRVKI